MRSLKCLYPLFTGVVLESQVLRFCHQKSLLTIFKEESLTFFSFLLSLVSLAPGVLCAEAMHTAPLQTRVLSGK